MHFASVISVNLYFIQNVGGEIQNQLNMFGHALEVEQSCNKF